LLELCHFIDDPTESLLEASPNGECAGVGTGGDGGRGRSGDESSGGDGVSIYILVLLPTSP